MAKNKVILTAGEAIKREGRLVSGTVQPGMFVMHTADADKNILTDKSTGSYVISDGSTTQVAIVDYSSVNGMASVDESGNVVTFTAGDQIPVIYPTNGCIVNVLTAATAAIAMGTPVEIVAGVVATSGSGEVFGFAAENWDPADYPTGTIKKIKVEVLK